MPEFLCQYLEGLTYAQCWKLGDGAIAIDESSLSCNDIIGWMQQEIESRRGCDGNSDSRAVDYQQGTLPLI